MIKKISFLLPVHSQQSNTPLNILKMERKISKSLKKKKKSVKK